MEFTPLVTGPVVPRVQLSLAADGPVTVQLTAPLGGSEPVVPEIVAV